MHILLFAPPFFDYYKEVQKEFSKRGIDYTYFNDRPSDTTLSKGLGRISYGLIQKSIDDYFYKVLKEPSAHSYDCLFVLGGMSFCFSRMQFAEIKKAAKCPAILYLWDSISNCQRVSDCLDLFDHIFTFEHHDAVDYGLDFLPLFYCDRYKNAAEIESLNTVYDACFIGSVHQPSKFKQIQSLVSKLEADGFNVYKYYFMPSRLVTRLRTSRYSFYRGEKYKYTPLSGDDIAKIYSMSKAVIDSPQANQSGLTMRTIETLGAKRKLITSNCSIAGYDFYQFGNVYISSDSLDDLTRFMQSEYNEIPLEMYEKYSINKWLDTILKAVN